MAGPGRGAWPGRAPRAGGSLAQRQAGASAGSHTVAACRRVCSSCASAWRCCSSLSSVALSRRSADISTLRRSSSESRCASAVCRRCASCRADVRSCEAACDRARGRAGKGGTSSCAGGGGVGWGGGGLAAQPSCAAHLAQCLVLLGELLLLCHCLAVGVDERGIALLHSLRVGGHGGISARSGRAADGPDLAGRPRTWLACSEPMAAASACEGVAARRSLAGHLPGTWRLRHRAR